MACFGFIFIMIQVSVITVCQCSSRANFTKRDNDKLTEFIDELMECRRMPGLSLAVVSNGETLITEGFGFADVESATRANSNTQFCVASLTKAFTATLLGKILKRHGHTWDTAVTDILGPDYQFLDGVFSGRATVRDLLLHRTGIPRYDYLWIAGIYKRNDLLRHCKCMKQKKTFRSTTMYNNVMYALAGKVVEVLTNQSYEENLKEEVLKPLDMTTSNFRHEEVPPSVNRASQYGFVYVDGPIIKLTADKYQGAEAIAPAISLCTTPTDMAKWIKFNLGENYNIVDEATIKEIHRGQIEAEHMFPNRIKPPLAPVSYVFDQYGLGWFVGEYRGLRVLMHYGSFPGFYSLISIIPEINFGIFTSINGGEQDYPWTINSIIQTVAIDLALDHQPWTDFKDACVFPPGSMETMKNDPFLVDTSYKYQRPLEEYAGIYYHPIFNNVTLTLFNRTQLQVKFGEIVFNAIPNSEKDSFTTSVIDKAWYIGPAKVTFFHSSESNAIDQVEIPFLEPKDPPVFKRPPQNMDIIKWRHRESKTCITSRSRESSYRLVSSSSSRFAPKAGAALLLFALEAMMLR